MYPHCNTEVLHAPGSCVYCDYFPERQQMRQASNTPFSPAEANGWQGNVAWTPQMVADEANHWETIASRCYGPSGSEELIRKDGRWTYREPSWDPPPPGLIRRLLNRLRRNG